MSELEKWAHRIALQVLIGEAFNGAALHRGWEKMQPMYDRADACYTAARDEALEVLRSQPEVSAAKEAARRAVKAVAEGSG